jgi:hypothetical protein
MVSSGQAAYDTTKTKKKNGCLYTNLKPPQYWLESTEIGRIYRIMYTQN